MKSKNEQALVGIFVIVATALLIGTVLAVSGTFSGGGLHYHTYFKSAGGLLPGATVRYAGMKAGKVDAVRVDPKDSTRIEIDFSVQNGIPVKTNSVAKMRYPQTNVISRMVTVRGFNGTSLRASPRRSSFAYRHSVRRAGATGRPGGAKCASARHCPASRSCPATDSRGPRARPGPRPGERSRRRIAEMASARSCHMV